MPVTTTTAANTIRETYEPGFVVSAFRNNSLLQHFPGPTDTGGDTAFRWKINSTGNDSVEIFTEGANQPVAGYQNIVNAAVSPVYFRFMLEVTGHARDALRSQWFDQLGAEMELGREDLVDLMTTSFMGSTYGIELSVDSTSSYAGITRTATSHYAATETAIGRSIAASDIMDILETMRDNDKGSKIGPGNGLILCPLNQATNIYRLEGVPAVQYIGDADKAPNLHTQTFARIPIVGLPDWTNTVICYLDMSPGHWVLAQHRPWTVHDQGRSGDADIFQVSWAGQLINKMPHWDGKHTGVTA
jgi:hypothetical protein